MFCLDDDIIDIGLCVAPDLPQEASLNGLLVGGAGILEAERHGVVAVGPEGGDERCLLLIRLLEVMAFLSRIIPVSLSLF